MDIFNETDKTAELPESAAPDQSLAGPGKNIDILGLRRSLISRSIVLGKISDLVSTGYFDMCAFEDIAEEVAAHSCWRGKSLWTGAANTEIIGDMLKILHCKKYKDMDAEVKLFVLAAIKTAFGVNEAAVPALRNLRLTPPQPPLEEPLEDQQFPTHNEPEAAPYVTQHHLKNRGLHVAVWIFGAALLGFVLGANAAVFKGSGGPIPTLPETAPAMSEMVPTLPETAPAMSEMVPTLPETAPAMSEQYYQALTKADTAAAAAPGKAP